MSALSLIARAVRTSAAAACVLACVAALAQVPTQSPTPGPAASDADDDEPITRSALDAPLFYQLLVGELELRSGEAGAAYQVVLDAARRTRDEALFRRATEIALQGRAGPQALEAVRAWRVSRPESLEALRYEAQLLVALDRQAEAVEPMRALIQGTPENERNAVIGALPRALGRNADKQQAARWVEQVLEPSLKSPSTQVAAQVAVGRAWLAADDSAKALGFAQRSLAQQPTSEAAALLALEMMGTTPAAEPLVVEFLKAEPRNTGMRLIYARLLSGVQRYAEATAVMQDVTRIDPKLAAPWLTLGALHLELRHPKEATAALMQYVQLVQVGGAAPAVEVVLTPGDDDGESTTTPVAAPSDQGLTQAYLMLAQAAEQQRDYAAAEQWLAKVSQPQRVLEVQARRASLLAQKGDVKGARELIRRAPEKTQEDARAKLIAEAHLLREAKQLNEAEKVLTSANQKYPDDVDLLYEQAMIAEKLDRMDEMEGLLRRVIALKPDYHHAYNALGYSLAERNQRLPEARELIRKALELSPGEPFITDSLGWVEYRLGNRDEALRLLQQAYRARPDVEIGTHLGEVLWVSGQRDEARKVLREARGRDAQNDVLREVLARLKVDL
jgi:tetratricopeptide (TPR) repeat protein